jgi:class 3 adenylate cyclase
VWGDTVNLASRLEEQGEPGEVLVSEPTATRCEERFGFGPVRVVEIKGKGPTRVRALLWPPPQSVDRVVRADAETP